jgi:hypothetical protein
MHIKLLPYKGEIAVEPSQHVKTYYDINKHYAGLKLLPCKGEIAVETPQHDTYYGISIL